MHRLAWLPRRLLTDGTGPLLRLDRRGLVAREGHGRFVGSLVEVEVEVELEVEAAAGIEPA